MLLASDGGRGTTGHARGGGGRLGDERSKRDLSPARLLACLKHRIQNQVNSTGWGGWENAD